MRERERERTGTSADFFSCSVSLHCSSSSNQEPETSREIPELRIFQPELRKLPVSSSEESLGPHRGKEGQGCWADGVAGPDTVAGLAMGITLGSAPNSADESPKEEPNKARPST